MAEAWICDFARTPIGRYGGALAAVRADDLAAVPIQALLARPPALSKEVDEVILGCANQAGEDNRNVARMAALLAGLPVEVPAVTVNRLCASGLEAVGQAARQIRLGEAEVVIAGGIEHMTRAPFVMAKAEAAFSRSVQIYDTTIGWRFVNAKIERAYGIDSMPETAENLAAEFRVARADQDAYAYRSQMRAKRAQEAGFFAEEIVPVEVPQRRGEPLVVARDEHPRPETTLDKLAALPTPFRQPGTVTAGNASGVNDGAAALLLAAPAAAERLGLRPRARVLAMASAGVPPRIMGYGPVPAIRKLLERLGRRLSEVEVLEINEAFAVQVLVCLRELGLADDAEHVNPNGGAIALGHPLGMSGARLALTLVHELERRGARFGVASLCVGVGQGLALAVERL